MKKFDFSGINAQEEDSRSTQKAPTPFGGSSSKVFDTSVFKDVETIKFAANKVYTVKLVPYEVDATHPKVIQGRMKPGQGAYVLDYTQHVVGPNKTMVCCPKGTFGKPCPICDRYFDLKQDDPKSEEAKSLKSSRRVMYNVVVLKSNDDKLEADPNKVRLLQASQYLFESPLLDELKKGDGDEIEAYHISDLCVGSDGMDMALKIMTSEDKVGDFTCIKFTFQIVKNKMELDAEELIEQAIPLHKALITLSADDLNNLLYGAEPTSEAVPADEEDDDDMIPVAKKSIADEDDEEDEDEDDAPASTGKCPSGYTFGEDAGMEDSCDDCPQYKQCREAKKAMRAARVSVED